MSPLNPTFIYYAGVYLFFLFMLQDIDRGYSLEPPHGGGSSVRRFLRVPTIYVLDKNKKNINFFTTLKILHIAMACFRNA